MGVCKQKVECSPEMMKEIRNDSCFHWLLTEYLRAIPRATQTFLAQRALLPEARHLQISGWGTLGKGSAHGGLESMKDGRSLQGSSFLHQQQQVDSPHLPSPHQPENRQGWGDGFLGALHNLRVCEANLNAGDGTLVFTPAAFDCLGDCQYFALSFFHLEIIEKKILTKPWPTGSVYNAWFIDVKTRHDKIVTCLRSEKDAEDKIIHGQVYVPSELQIDT